MENDTAVWDIPGNMPSLPTWLIMTVDKNVHTPPLVEVLKKWENTTWIEPQQNSAFLFKKASLCIGPVCITLSLLVVEISLGWSPSLQQRMYYLKW